MNIRHLLLLLILLTACQEGTRTTVGVIAPLSGEYARLGEDVQDAMFLSDTQYELHFEDDHSCSPREGVTSANRLVNIENVDILVTTCTNLVEPIHDITSKNDVVLVQLFESPKRSHDIYQVLPSSKQLYLGLAQITQGKVCILQEEGALMELNANAFIEGIPQEVVLRQRIPQSTKNFRTLIEKCEEKDAEKILPLMGPSMKRVFFKQLIEQDSDLELIADINDELNMESYGASLALFDGTYITSFNLTAREGFKNKFLAEYGREPELAAILAFDAIEMLPYFLNQTDSFEHSGALGTYAFEEGISESDIYVKRYEDGNWKVVSRTSLT